MRLCLLVIFIVFFKQKTAYELRISDWSSDVCSSDLSGEEIPVRADIGSLMPIAGLPGGDWVGYHYSSTQPGELVRIALSPHGAPRLTRLSRAREIGRASCRESVCQYVSISVDDASLKKQTIHTARVHQHKHTV